MAKKQFDDDLISSSSFKRIQKKQLPDETEAEKVVKQVHTKKRGRTKTNTEKTVRYTIDIPETVYKALRHKVVDEGGTMKDYMMKVLKKDLKI